MGPGHLLGFASCNAGFDISRTGVQPTTHVLRADVAVQERTVRKAGEAWLRHYRSIRSACVAWPVAFEKLVSTLRDMWNGLGLIAE